MSEHVYWDGLFEGLRMAVNDLPELATSIGATLAANDIGTVRCGYEGAQAGRLFLEAANTVTLCTSQPDWEVRKYALDGGFALDADKNRIAALTAAYYRQPTDTVPLVDAISDSQPPASHDEEDWQPVVD